MSIDVPSRPLKVFLRKAEGDEVALAPFAAAAALKLARFEMMEEFEDDEEREFCW